MESENGSNFVFPRTLYPKTGAGFSRVGLLSFFGTIKRRFLTKKNAALE
jgi:hypothetical protein